MKVEAGGPSLSAVALYDGEILKWSIGSIRGHGAVWQSYEKLLEIPEETVSIYGLPGMA